MSLPDSKRSRGAAVYPVPQEQGGRLIRHLIRSFRTLEISLPITSHILIATSGGSDSTALAVLIARYGRKIIPEPRTQLTLLHINHGWRGAESQRDEAFVRELAATLGVGFMGHRLSSSVPPGDSWEDHARSQRKAIYRAEAEESDALVFTGHTADDLAETLLWRIFTGAFERERAGILDRHGLEVRPLLGVRKAPLQAFLREEGIEWREDQTNHEGRFLRSRMRTELMPVIESIFPRGLDHLLALRKAPESSAARGSRKKKTKRGKVDSGPRTAVAKKASKTSERGTLPRR